MRASSNVRLVGQDGPGSAGHDQPSGPTTITCRAGTRASGSRSRQSALGRRGADWDSWKQRYCRQSLIIFPDAPVCYWRGGLLRWAANSPRHRKGLEKGSSRAPDFPPGLPQWHDADGCVRPEPCPAGRRRSSALSSGVDRSAWPASGIVRSRPCTRARGRAFPDRGRAHRRDLRSSRSRGWDQRIGRGLVLSPCPGPERPHSRPRQS